MKHGSEYAKRIKRLFHQLARKFGKPAATEPPDPTEQLIVGILSACTSSTKAHAIFRKLRQEMVDLNELRVTPPTELATLIGDGLPLALNKARRVVDALNDIRRRQDTLDLGFLKQRGRREAREYLESLEGVDRSAAASVVLYSLGGHAIPVDELTLYVLRKEELVDPSADAAEVQGFLERHISASDARVFAILLSRHVSSRASRVPIEEFIEPAPAPQPTPSEAATKEAAAETKPAKASKKAAEKKSSPAAKPKRDAPKGKTAARSKGAAARGPATGRRKKK